MGVCCSKGAWPPNEGDIILGDFDVSFISKRFDSRPISCSFSMTSQQAALIDRRNDILLMNFHLSAVDDVLAMPLMNRLIITLKTKERIIIECAKISEIEELMKFSKYMDSNTKAASPFPTKLSSSLEKARGTSPIE